MIWYNLCMQHFRKLKIWNDSLEFTKEIYQITNNFPKHEIFGLTSQTRRAASNINLNIAEGCGNNSNLEFRRFLHLSLRSTYEVMSCIDLAYRLNYLEKAQTDDLLDKSNQIAAMIYSLIKKLA